MKESPTSKNMFLYEFIIYVDYSRPANLINKAAVFDIFTVFPSTRLLTFYMTIDVIYSQSEC